ncbi:helix-turn-helix transcriptional regulator [Actinosynnema sp. NPDC023587]|uniref:helix-turn-helix domain-containing protein n=1 Tax=Actinosynnema sp. NPDC023587 TaxID=3154695 RepID=UPI0033E03D55
MSQERMVGTVVGGNLERLRRLARMTQHEAARLFARRGTPLSRSKIAAIEAGERPNLSFADVLAIAHAFNVELAELFAGDDDVTLSNRLTLPSTRIRDLITGAPGVDGGTRWGLEWRRELLDLTHVDPEIDQELQTSEADRALALRLRIPPETVIAVAVELWGRTLSEERDLRVEGLGGLDGAERGAHRGHITRELSQEIQSELVAQGLLAEVVDESDQRSPE